MTVLQEGRVQTMKLRETFLVLTTVAYLLGVRPRCQQYHQH